MSKSDNDCYYYYYSTCTKGDDCEYRHCQSALGSEVTCTHWRDGQCMRASVCKYRHMESRINRSSIQCWFETQPMGCRKPHCVFLHKKPRLVALDEEQTLTSADGVILPVLSANASTDNNETNNNNLNIGSNGNAVNVNTNSGNLTQNTVKRGDESTNCSKIRLFDDSDYLNQSLSAFNDSTTNHNINIEPISISLNDCDEESDNESDRNVDQNSRSRAYYELNPNNDYNSDSDYGIKTLEQIRMEKVFNSDNEDSVNEDLNNHCFDKNESQLKAQQQMKTNKDLRVKIKRQKLNDFESTVASVSNSFNSSFESSTDFGIKTLDQIRRERQESAKKSDTNTDHKSGLKENQEPRGTKRSASDPNTAVVKIRRSGPTAISSLKVQQKSESKDTSNQNIVDKCDQTVNSSESESNESSNAVTSTDTNHKLRIKSIDTDLDDFDFLEGESNHNIDSNDAIDDEDDELMREINQVINS